VGEKEGRLREYDTLGRRFAALADEYGAAVNERQGRQWSLAQLERGGEGDRGGARPVETAAPATRSPSPSSSKLTTSASSRARGRLDPPGRR
jgi:hypothetical protein